MIWKRLRRSVASALCVSLILCASCTTTPVPFNTVPELGGSDGLLVVGFDQGALSVNMIVLEPKLFGSDIRIDRNSPNAVGLSLSLYVAPEGTYCLKSFVESVFHFEARSAHDLCANVRAGELTYYGHLSPGVELGSVYQTYQYEAMYEELRNQYPAIFTQYASTVEAPKLNPIIDITPPNISRKPDH
ncbi:MAG TPA: hypothetical protein VNF46_06715 [Gammaproteobacteria bacterium]|nr:hypothetical protein [Gammaproteobacteria bacterium]